MPDKERIRVVIRVRPFNGREAKEEGGLLPAFEIVKPCTILIANDASGTEKRLGFDNVFASDPAGPCYATQQTMYESVGFPLVENALSAYNGCAFFYGQTGSGKSHSCLGNPKDELQKGILPRTCECLFEMLQQESSKGETFSYQVISTYLEIYNEKLSDLLLNPGKVSKDLHVRLHPEHGPHVPGLTESLVANYSDVSELLDFGAKNRIVAATNMNAQSSRSHAIFSLEVRINRLGVDSQSRIHVVDLAGSERQKKTGAEGDRLKEGIAINQSLSALGKVISALTAQKNNVPPFRDSKLTLLLKECLSGNSKTVLVACVSPSAFNLEETHSTLEFASRCKLISTNSKKNEVDRRDQIEALEAEKKLVESQLQAEQDAKLQVLVLMDAEKARTSALELEMAEMQNKLATSFREEAVSKHQQLHQQLIQDKASAQAELEEAKQRAMEAHAQDQAEKQQAFQKLEQAIAEKELLRKEQKLSLEQSVQSSLEREALAAEREQAIRELQEMRKQLSKQAEDESMRGQLALKLEELEALQAEKEALRLEREGVLETLAQEQAAKEHILEKRMEELQKAELERNGQEMELQKEREARKTEEQRMMHRIEELKSQKDENHQRQVQELEAQIQSQTKQVGEREKALAELQKREREHEEHEMQLKKEHETRQAKEQEMLQRIEELKKLMDDSAQRQVQDFESQIKMHAQLAGDKEKEMVATVADLQSRLTSLQASNEELEERAKEQREKREPKNYAANLSPKEREDCPRLAMLHRDPFLSKKIVFFVPAMSGESEASDIHVGSAEHCQIQIEGLGMKPEMCTLRNVENKQLFVSHCHGLVCVNGKKVDSDEQELHNKNNLAIGESYIFEVELPLPARTQPRRSLLLDEELFERALQELDEGAEIEHQWKKVIEKTTFWVKQDFGTKEANSFLLAAKRASSKLKRANAILDKLPNEWRKNIKCYDLAVLFDNSGLPILSVVARARADPIHPKQKGQTVVPADPPLEGKTVDAVWTITEFEEERLPELETAQDNAEFKKARAEAMKTEQAPSASSWTSVLSQWSFGWMMPASDPSEPDRKKEGVSLLEDESSMFPMLGNLVKKAKTLVTGTRNKKDKNSHVVSVTEFFNGKLGLKIKNCKISGFEVPEAQKIGWEIDDEIVALNGQQIEDQKHLNAILKEERRNLPLNFTIRRQKGKKSCAPKLSIQQAEDFLAPEDSELLAGPEFGENVKPVKNSAAVAGLVSKRSSGARSSTCSFPPKQIAAAAMTKQRKLQDMIRMTDFLDEQTRDHVDLSGHIQTQSLEHLDVKHMAEGKEVEAKERDGVDEAVVERRRSLQEESQPNMNFTLQPQAAALWHRNSIH